MKKYGILIIILLVAAFLRLNNLASYPVGLNADEAALGYNAYSLMQTGRDEHGHAWPVNFESFGDFKPALYGYVLIPFIKVFGLTSLAVRLPAALAGIMAVALVYWLTKMMFSQAAGLLSAGYLAISPWHIHFSRGGWEVNLATTFILAGICFFFKWLKQPKYLYLGACVLGFVLSMYTYQSARLLAPVLGLGMALFFLKPLILARKQAILAGLLGLIVLIPLLNSFMSASAFSRASGVGLFADIGPINRVNQLRGQYSASNLWLGKILQNKITAYTFAFIENYTDHFSGNFLFINGDVIQRNRVPETGLLYWTDLPFLLLGIFVLAKAGDKPSKFIGFWLLISPLAAALTFQTPHALRAQLMIIPLAIIIGLGLRQTLQKLNFKVIVLILVLVYSWQIARYLHEYYVHYPKTYPAAWENGFAEAVSYVQEHKNDYNQVLVTTKYDQPYILFLFYLHYPPQQFQFHHTLTVRDKFNFSTVESFDKYQFMDTAWDKVQNRHQALIVAAPEDIPPTSVNIVKTVYFPNGQPAFKIIAN